MDICMRTANHSETSSVPPRLIIIAVSHFCEKAVWALHRSDPNACAFDAVSLLFILSLADADMAYTSRLRRTLQ
jgi:hypothetical protein